MFRKLSALKLPLFILAVVAATAPAPASAATSLDNLQAAYGGESNAKVRYEAFAVKADEEGHAGVAALFRAAAKAESIHLATHAEVIKKMGGTPLAEIKAPTVGTTRENLEAASKGEAYEQQTMYPQFLKQARAEGNKRAVRTFRFARSAESEHLALYNSALANLDAWRTARTFWVCPECGSTLAAAPTKKCEVCYTKAGEYLKIS